MWGDEIVQPISFGLQPRNLGVETVPLDCWFYEELANLPELIVSGSVVGIKSEDEWGLHSDG